MRFIFVMMALAVLCSCSSESNTLKKTAKAGVAKTSNAAKNAVNSAAGAVSGLVNGRTKDPTVLATEVFNSLKSNDLSKFSNCIINDRHIGEFKAMLNSVELSTEQKATSMGFVTRTLNSWSQNDNALTANFFNNLLKKGENDFGINWKNAELKNVQVDVVPVTDFQINQTVYQMHIDFESDGDAHQLKIPTAYNLQDGILIADAQILR